MSAPAVTVADALPPPDNGWTNHVLGAKDGPGFTFILKKLPKLDGVLTRDGAASAVAGKIHELMHVDLGVILIGAWRKLSELQNYTDADKYGPEETILVELTRHTVSSTHTPTLDIILNGKTIDTIKFELKLTILIDGAVLTIKGGRILSVSPGEMKGSAELKCETYKIINRETVPLRLPTAWTFEKPIDISAFASGDRQR